MQRISIQNYPI